MQPVLNLWSQTTDLPKAWRGERLLLNPSHPPALVKDQIIAWVEAHPLGWLIAKGPAVAVLIQIAAERLDLRIAGAALVDPQDWLSAHGGVVLSETPLSFPCVIFPCATRSVAVSLRLRRLAAAWHARVADLLPERGPMESPLMQAMMTDRLASLRPALQAADSAAWATKADRDLESSTAATASRTASIVRRTAQVASSTQSVQGT